MTMRPFAILMRKVEIVRLKIGERLETISR